MHNRCAIVTHYTPEIKFACEPFIRNQAEYAQHWKFDYTCHTDVHSEFTKVPAQYSKLLYIRELLTAGYPVVVWADADIGFTNFTKDVTELLRDGEWLAGMRELNKPHAKYICAGLLVFRNSPEALAALDHCIRLVKSGKFSAVTGEQEQRDLNEYLQKSDYAGVHACTEDEIGSVWDLIGLAPLLRSWKRGDLHIHCSIYPWDVRGAVFLSRYARQVIRTEGEIVARQKLLTDGFIPEAENQILQEDVEKVKLFIGTPCHGGTVALQYTTSMLKLTAVLAENGISHAFRLYNGEMVARARNKIAADFLKSDCTHLLMVDSDIGFRAIDVLGMIAANMHIVGGIYPKKEYCFERMLNTARGDESDEKAYAAALNYVWTPLGCSARNLGGGKIKIDALEQRRCVEVAEVGSGFMLIKRELFELFAERYPYFSYADDFESSVGTRITTFFDYVIFNDRYISEDYFLCSFWREMGGRVWAWPWAKLDHVGHHVFQGQFKRLVTMENQATPVAAL